MLCAAKTQLANKKGASLVSQQIAILRWEIN